MQAVWRQLMRPEGAGRFYYPARIESLSPYIGSLEYAKVRSATLRDMGEDDDARAELRSLRVRAKHSRSLQRVAVAEIAKLPANIRQEVACASFFSNAVQFASWETTVFTTGDVDVATQEMRLIADKLESSSELASAFLKIEVPSIVRRMVDKLRKSAASFEHYKNDALVVKRRRSDDRIRTFAIRLNARAQEIFGQHFHGQIATISNVIFEDSKMTDARIREMVRPKTTSRGGVRRVKKTP